MTAIERGNAAKERILLASIASLERLGIENITTRAIAGEAQVNVAAVNYHFGSKDALLQAALEKVRERGMGDPVGELEAELARLAAGRAQRRGTRSAAARRVAEQADLRKALEHTMLGVLSSSVRSPRSTFAHLRRAIVDHDYTIDGVARTNAVVYGLERRLQTLIVGRNTKERSLALAQAWSALVMACLAPNMFQYAMQLDLTDEKSQRTFVSALIARTLVAPSRSGSSTRPGSRPRSRSRATRR